MSTILQELLGNAADGGAVFDILQPDSFFIPYGEYRHKQGLQIFDRDSAAAVAANHDGMLGKIKRWAAGASYPVYIGHPDLPGSKDADKRAYGWIETMAVENDGLRLNVKWSEAGRELVANGMFKFYSPLWWTKKAKTGIRPVALKSMGLTNDPNIPVPALANEADEVSGQQSAVSGEEAANDSVSSPMTDDQSTNDQTEDMNPELLAALGLEADATPEQALAKITEFKQAAEAAAAAKAEETTAEDPAKETTETAAQDEATQQEANAACSSSSSSPMTGDQSTNDQLRKKLNTAANDAVQAAVTAGRITPAEADAKVDELLAANDLAAALHDLRTQAAKVKTASATGDLGAAKTRLVLAANDESKAAREARAVAVANEYDATNQDLPTGERKRIAWERAQRKNPELFGKS